MLTAEAVYSNHIKGNSNFESLTILIENFSSSKGGNFSAKNLHLFTSGWVLRPSLQIYQTSAFMFPFELIRENQNFLENYSRETSKNHRGSFSRAKYVQAFLKFLSFAEFDLKLSDVCLLPSKNKKFSLAESMFLGKTRFWIFKDELSGKFYGQFTKREWENVK